MDFLFVLEATGIVQRDPHLIFELNGDEGFRTGLCSAPMAKDMGLTGFTVDSETNAFAIDEGAACSIVARLFEGCHTPKRLGGVAI